jgi:hypothetical protein
VLKSNEYALEWADAGSPRANWAINSSLLRMEMRLGRPIRDVSPGNIGGPFLNAERNLLRNHGWRFDDGSGYWLPPGS